jgi:3-hydroxyisobutyrate dehydrogenase
MLGYIGLGAMGTPMVRRLLNAGHAVTVWNRSAEKAAPLVAEGATLAASPLEVIRQAEIVCLCVTDPTAVEAVINGPQGLLAVGEAGRGRIVIDFSTIDPELTRDIATRFRAEGMEWIDAPVSGGVPGAEAGTLTLFLGGEPEVLAQAEPVFAAVGRHVTRMGSTGAGQTTKLCNQMIVATNFLALAETYAAARRMGVNVDAMAPAMAGGFADSRPLQIFGPRMATHTYTPRLGEIAVLLKDVRLGLKAADAAGASTPLLEFCRSRIAAIGETGGALSDDLTALIRLYEADPAP